MFYRIIDERLYDYADYKYNSDCLETNIITQSELDLHKNKVIVSDGKLIINPNYEEEQQQKEKERISKLRCTKRVFALCLKEFGISYSQLKEVIASNENAQLEWDLCVELERCNPMIDTMASKLGITSKQLDLLFRYANGELESLEV